jgi:hypothetical protein
MVTRDDPLLRLLVKAYTGCRMNVGGYSLPVVIDLAGMSYGKSLVANLDHNYTKRVGNVTHHDASTGVLLLTTDINAATDSSSEVERSIAKGFKWQASIEATPIKATRLKDDETAMVNGRAVSGPAYVITQSILKGFAFVSHGADDNTEVVLSQRQ